MQDKKNFKRAQQNLTDALFVEMLQNNAISEIIKNALAGLTIMINRTKNRETAITAAIKLIGMQGQRNVNAPGGTSLPAIGIQITIGPKIPDAPKDGLLPKK